MQYINSTIKIKRFGKKEILIRKDKYFFMIIVI